MKPTKRQRNAVYTMALSLYKAERGYIGMCSCIDDAHFLFFGSHLFSSELNNYPEFLALKPLMKRPRAFWWDMNLDRTPFFEQIIKETESC